MFFKRLLLILSVLFFTANLTSCGAVSHGDYFSTHPKTTCFIGTSLFVNAYNVCLQNLSILNSGGVPESSVTQKDCDFVLVQALVSFEKCNETEATKPPVKGLF